MLTINDKLKKLYIPVSIYRGQIADLQALGYSSSLADKIVLQKGSRKTVKRLLSLHNKLIEYYKRSDIAKIASIKFASKHLKSALLYFKPLQKLGFTTKQITKMSSNGGSKNIKTVKGKFVELKQLGFKYYLMRQ